MPDLPQKPPDLLAARRCWGQSGVRVEKFPGLPKRENRRAGFPLSESNLIS
jgi:hypothetical protein